MRSEEQPVGESASVETAESDQVRILREREEAVARLLEMSRRSTFRSEGPLPKREELYEDI